jgi:hypothetical protein
VLATSDDILRLLRLRLAMTRGRCNGITHFSIQGADYLKYPTKWLSRDTPFIEKLITDGESGDYEREWQEITTMGREAGQALS